MFSNSQLSKILLISICLTLLLGVYVVFFTSQTVDLVYIDNKKVFESFKMTHDVKVIGDNTLDTRSRIIDSLYAELNEPANKEIKDILMQKIMFEKESLAEFNESFSAQETDKIWKRIQTYAGEYAQQNDYKIILGAQPDYNILYGDGSMNKTVEFLEFINSRYDGNK